MRDVVDTIASELAKREELFRTRIEAYGPVAMPPDDYPYVNVLPWRKPRKRVYYLGTSTMEYDSTPQVQLHVWHYSVESRKEAFYRCEDLAETVQDLLASISATDLGVDYHESQIEQYDQGQYERGFVYRAVILWTARDRESHT